MGSTSAGNTARQRIDALLDDNSFIEIGAMVKARSTDFNIKSKDTPSDGVVTGYGLIDGRLVYVYSQDPTVLGGSVGEMHAEKIVRLYEMAIKMGAPIVGMIDSTGLRLQESVDGLDAFGRIYRMQSMASGVIPQISVVYGNCGGGLCVSAGLSDFTLMEKDNARMFVNSPDAVVGNRKEVCDSSTSKFQAETAGNVDFVGDFDEVNSMIRNLISVLPSNNGEDADAGMCDDDLNREVAELNDFDGDTGRVLESISDGRFVLEIKKDFASEMLTAFIRLNGATVGVIANRAKMYDEENDSAREFDAKLTAKGCRKASEFTKLCDAFNIPILTLSNVNGYAADMCEEKNGARQTAGLIYAFANATVPKVGLIVGDATGSAAVAMNSKSIGADMVYAWPDAKVGMMDPKCAVEIMYADEIDSSNDKTSFIKEKADAYGSLQGSIDMAASRGYIDTVISKEDTRKYLIGAFEMLYTKLEDRPDKKHGTV